MSEARVNIERRGHVAVVSLARPDKRNALDIAMFEALDEAAGSLATDPELRAVVLTGEGRSFCAGLDLAAFASGASEMRKLLDRPDGEVANLAQRVGWNWRQCPVPVIAALHGEVFGGGLQVALGADLRFARPDARLSVMEVRWGLIPDMAGSQTLRNLVRRDVALELAWTGRVVGGEEALALGLVTRLAEDPLAEAVALAETIAGHSPDAVRGVKRLFNEAWHSGEEAALRLEEALQLQIIGRPNQMEAVRAGMAGEAPRFGPARDLA
ncbi:MAG: crotonase/enoyl-CoA hydratase family protein [Gammaproteobacteria bacterium]|jgi:enoyl-CoA hydratase/carnithine racemase